MFTTTCTVGLIDIDVALHLGLLGHGRQVQCKPNSCKFTGFSQLTTVPRDLISIDLCVYVFTLLLFGDCDEAMIYSSSDINLLGLVKVDLALELGLLTDDMPRVPCSGSGTTCPQPSGKALHKRRLNIGQ